MHRPFEAVGAVLVGLLAYTLILAGYQSVTGTPADWPLEIAGLVAFVFGAFITRVLWR